MEIDKKKILNIFLGDTGGIFKCTLKDDRHADKGKDQN